VVCMSHDNDVFVLFICLLPQIDLGLNLLPGHFALDVTNEQLHQTFNRRKHDAILEKDKKEKKDTELQEAYQRYINCWLPYIHYLTCMYDSSKINII
jgi:hypothetical protein